MKKISLEDVLILSAIRAARFWVHVLPMGFSLGVARGIGALVFRFSKRRKVALKNLRAVFASEKSEAELERLARRSFENLAMSAVELLRVPDIDRRYIESHVEVIGAEKLEQPLKEGRGIIFLTAHFGNWELLNVTGSLLGYPMVALARAQKHPRSDEYLNRIRASKGTQIIRKGMPIREILRALRNGQIVGMLSDQDGGKNGVFVNFFNRLSSTPSGAAAFALRTNAVIFPIFISRKEGTYHRVEVEGPIEMPGAGVLPEEAEKKVLQRFADLLESKIRRQPDQWLWAHRRWKSTPNRSVLILSDGKAGHGNQSLAVFEAIRERLTQQGVSEACLGWRSVRAEFRSVFFKNLLAAAVAVTGGHLPFKRALCRTVLTRACFETLSKTYADIVISCGYSLVGVNLFVKEENQARSVVVMKPPCSPRHFDVLIAPRHDKIKKAANVFVTEGALCTVSSGVFDSQARRLAEELGLEASAQKIGLLLGGDTEGVSFLEAPTESLFRTLNQYCEKTESLLLATSSRRTPLWAENLLKRYFQKNRRCPLLVIANEANREGVVKGILGLCHRVVVSGESMSMVSEAVCSGKPVVIFMPFDRERLKKKYREFLNRLVEAGRAVEATASTFGDILTHPPSLRFSAIPDSESDGAVLERAVQGALQP
jgi:KDO2-lipid IV(A) lauroyltransferase